MLDFQRIVNALRGGMHLCINSVAQWALLFAHNYKRNGMRQFAVECLNPTLKRYVSFVSHQRFYSEQTVMFFFFSHIQSFFFSPMA